MYSSTYSVCIANYKYHYMPIHTTIHATIRTPIRSGGIGMYSIHTNTYWYVFWHVFCLYRAFAVLIPTNTDLNARPGTGSDTYQYVQHYMPIQTTTCQYRPLRAYYTLEYMLSTCQTAPSPQYEPPLWPYNAPHPSIHRIRATDCRSRGGKVRQASIKRAPCIGNAFIIALH